MYRVVLNSNISDLLELIQAVDYSCRHFMKSYGPGPELNFPCFLLCCILLRLCCNPELFDNIAAAPGDPAV